MILNKIKILFLLFFSTMLVSLSAFAQTEIKSNIIHIGVFNSKQDAQNFYKALPNKITSNIHKEQLWFDVYKSHKGILQHYVNVSELSYRNAESICQSITLSFVECIISGIDPLLSPSKTYRKSFLASAEGLPMILQPFGLRLRRTSSDIADIDLKLEDQKTNIAYSDLPDIETYSENFTLEPQILDTQEALAAKAAYGVARNKFISALQSIGAGVNAGKGAEAARENLIALGREAFEAAGSAYYRDFWKKSLNKQRPCPVMQAQALHLFTM